MLSKAAKKDPAKKALAQQLLKELFSGSAGKPPAKPEWHCQYRMMLPCSVVSKKHL